MRELAPDTRLLHLQTPRSHRLRFLAGQSVTLGASARPRPRATTCTRPTRSPAAPATTATCISSSRATTATRSRARCSTATLKAGDAVNLWGPMGEFVLADSAHPLVFAACDTGFAPVKSLIEHALSLDTAPSLVAVLARHAQRRPLPWPTSAAPGRRRSTPSSMRCSPTATPPPARARWRAAMRADLFDIDCDFYLAGPQDVRRRARRGLARRRRSRGAGGVRRSCDAVARRQRLQRRRSVRAARAGRQHGPRVPRGRDRDRRTRWRAARGQLRAGARRWRVDAAPAGAP